MRAVGKRVRLQVLAELRRVRTAVHPHVAQVAPEAWLEERPGWAGQRLPRGIPRADPGFGGRADFGAAGGWASRSRLAMQAARTADAAGATRAALAAR